LPRSPRAWTPPPRVGSYLLGWDEDTEGEETEDEPEDPESVLALIKSMPGNVSLESMLTEIRKPKAGAK